MIRMYVEYANNIFIGYPNITVNYANKHIAISIGLIKVY